METQTQAKPKIESLMSIPNRTSVITKKEDVLPDFVVFRAYRPKTQLPVKVSPLQDLTGKHWTGQGKTGYFEDLTENDKKEIAYVITPKTVITISEGKTLACKASITDAANWKWIKKHPYVAISKEAGNSSRDAVYYVYNQLAIAEDKVTKSEKADKARYKLRFDISPARRVEIAESLGFPEPRTANDTIVLEWLLDRTVDESETILKLMGDDEESKATQRAMALFHALNRYKIIQKFRAGTWRWSGENGLVLGMTNERVIEFLTNPANAETVVALEAELQEKKLIEEQL